MVADLRQTAAPTNLSAFASRFRIDDGELVVAEERLIKVGETGSFFHSYCKLDDSLYSLNVRYPVFPLHRMGEPDFHADRVFLNRHERRNGRLETTQRIDLGPGGDPRVVSDGENAFAVIIGNPLSGERALLYDLRRDQLIPIRASDPDFFFGKNWQPYLKNGELFAVHEMVPFRIVRIDTETGNVIPVHEVDMSFRLPCFHTGYTMFRGGSNAIEHEGHLFGVGRATSQRFRHHPFFWSFDGDEHVEMTFTEFFSGFYRAGFNIIDPTSLFFDGDDLYLGLCCSERDWVHSQLVSHLLIAFRAGGPKRDGEAVRAFLENRAPSPARHRRSIDSQLFFCVEMPSAIAHEYEHAGRLSTGSAGHLVYGPYVEIQTAGSYCAELSYLTWSGPGQRAGEFDVTVSRLDEQGRVYELKTVGRTDITYSHSEMAEVRIHFDTYDLVGWRLETRVFVEEHAKLNAFHVRTWRCHSSTRECVPYGWAQRSKPTTT